MIGISNVVNISTQLPQRGLSNFNPNNALVLTNEVPINDDPFTINISSDTVRTDWGSNSKALLAVQDIFAQAPSLRNGNGYVVVAGMILSESSASFSLAPTAGSYDLEVLGQTHTVAWDDTAAEIQAALRLLPGLSSVIISKTATSIKVISPDTRGSFAGITIDNNTLVNAATPVVITLGEVVEGETVLEAITRLKELVEFVAVMETFETSDAEILASGPFVQSQDNKLIHIVSTGEEADVEVGGIAFELMSQGLTHTRHLYKSGSESDRSKMKASYIGKMFSVNFAAPNSTMTDHMKDLAGVSGDESINQTLLTKIKNAGSVCYPVIQGIPKVFSSGKNWFFDRVHNLLWFISAAQIAYFNVLAKASRKVPQTEAGMSLCVGSIRRVCDQAVLNGYVAPGEWTSEEFFGDREDFLRNIREKGYYIWYGPLSQQSPADREERNAPPIMIAIKEAGAIHQGNIIVSINP